MNRRVLLGSFEPPRLGGASTNAYALFRKMRHDGLDVHHVNLIDEFDVPFLELALGDAWGDPDQLGNVRDCLLDGTPECADETISRLVRDVDPDVIVARGDTATSLLKRAAPDRPVVFLVAGSQQVRVQIERGAATSASALLETGIPTARAPTLFPGPEVDAVQRADLIIACSPLVRELLERLFPYWDTGKLLPDVLWSAEWIRDAVAARGLPSKPFDARRLDLLFVASTWSRREKNFEMVARLVARLPRLRVGIVGECPRPVPGATSYGFMGSAARALELMGDARALVCPSVFDASPGVLFEAATMGCNVVASKNCGNWMICNEALLVDPFAEEQFVQAAERATRRRYEPNLEYFLDHSYERLLAILDVL